MHFTIIAVIAIDAFNVNAITLLNQPGPRHPICNGYRTVIHEVAYGT